MMNRDKLIDIVRYLMRIEFGDGGREFTFDDVKRLLEEAIECSPHRLGEHKHEASRLGVMRRMLQDERRKHGLIFIDGKPGHYRYPHSKYAQETNVLHDPRKAKVLPNLTYPTITPVRARDFELDLSENRQRDAEMREKKLRRDFGDNGERFDFDKFEVITGVRRANGKVFPSNGMGRIWAIVNLLKRPDLELPCLIVTDSGDQAEKLAFVHTHTNTTPIKDSQLFMTFGNMAGDEYAGHRKIVAELKLLNLTTEEGHGPDSVTCTSAIFCARVGYLQPAYTLARRWWFSRRNAKGNYTGKVEGSAMTAIAAFLYCFDSPKLDYKRCDKLFADLDYSGENGLKETACEKWIKTSAAHQGRDDATAVVREMIHRYNRNMDDSRRLEYTALLQIREDFANDQFLDKMHDTWRMYDENDREAGKNAARKLNGDAKPVPPKHDFDQVCNMVRKVMKVLDRAGAVKVLMEAGGVDGVRKLHPSRFDAVVDECKRVLQSTKK